MNKEQGFLLVMVVLSGIVSLLIVLPFLQYILAAVLVAYVLYPIHNRLRPLVGSRLAPIIVMLGAVIAVFAPVAYLTVALARDLVALSRGDSGLETDAIETTVHELSGQRVDLADPVNTVGTELFDILFTDIASIVSFGVQFSLGFVLMLFVVYYLLRDGDRSIEWIIDVAPMKNTVCRRVFVRVDDTTWGVVVGHLLVAVLQGLIGGVGLFVAGVPSVVFWTFAMIVFALLPLVGAFVIWGPAAAYLVSVGRSQAALFLLLYGLLVVSLIDNYARPILIDREAHLNPAVILIGVFGGTYAIGMTGLFLGPIVLAVFVTTITAFDEEYDALEESATETTGDSEAVRRAS